MKVSAPLTITRFIKRDNFIKRSHAQRDVTLLQVQGEKEKKKKKTPNPEFNLNYCNNKTERVLSALQKNSDLFNCPFLAGMVEDGGYCRVL